MIDRVKSPDVASTSELITTTERRLPSKPLRTFAEFFTATVCGLTFGLTLFVFLLSMVSVNIMGSRDFALAWSTGQQLVHGANPYDGNVLVRIEQVIGHPLRYRGLMRNPPWALPLVYPLGFFGLRFASILWNFLQLACLLASVRILWKLHGRPRNRRVLLGYCFAPALICLIMGQTTILALLGLVLFLRLHRTHPFLAGAALWLCLLKPHLFLPFGVVLLAWIVVNRAYGLLLGVATSIAVSCACVELLDPMAWSQYGQVLHTPGSPLEFVPCLSILLRTWIGKETAGFQYLPAALGCIWALAYFWPRRAAWEWIKDGSLLMLVSILVTPYSWLYDQVLVIPALLDGAFATRSRTMLAVLAFLSALIEMALLCIAWKPSALYIWTLWSAPAWLIWYLAAGGIAQRPPDDES